MMIIALLLLNGCVSYSYFSGRKFWEKLVFTGIVTSFLGGLIYLNPVTRYRSEEIMITSDTFQLDTVHTQSVSIRASLWWQGIKAFQSVNPFLGAGTGDVIAAMEKSGALHHISNVMNSFDPHNQFLYTLIGLGCIGLLALLSCLLLPALFAVRQRDYFYLGFVLIFTLLCITQSALEFQKGITFFAIFNSILVFGYCDLRIPSLKQFLHD
jgi:O-antigen ligase